MRESLTVIASLLFGTLLGLVFFGALWWTVRKGLASHRPELWFLGSLLVRTAIVLAGFFAVTPAGPWPMAACLVGFTAAKVAVTRLTKPPLALGAILAH